MKSIKFLLIIFVPFLVGCKNSNVFYYYKLLDDEYSSIYKIKNLDYDLFGKIGNPISEAIGFNGNRSEIYDWGTLFYAVNNEFLVLKEINIKVDSKYLNKNLSKLKTINDIITRYGKPEYLTHDFIYYRLFDINNGGIKIYYDNSKKILSFFSYNEF